jgi:SAM-dependent methyltransferase
VHRVIIACVRAAAPAPYDARTSRRGIDMAGDTLDAMHAYYARGFEQGRLTRPDGEVEFERSREIIGRHLPPAPAVVADIGGGPGRYSLWLAGLGYAVRLRDVVPLHVEQARAAAAEVGVDVDARVGDARELDLLDASVDVVLLLGPLYHLAERDDRIACLREARRVLRPGGVVFAAGISRWGPRLGSGVVAKLYHEYETLPEALVELEATGVMAPIFDGDFNGYCHRPDELRAEIADAGLACVDLVSVESIAFALPDLGARLADAVDRAALFDAIRALERVPELLGLGPHLLATARRS